MAQSYPARKPTHIQLLDDDKPIKSLSVDEWYKFLSLSQMVVYTRVKERDTMANAYSLYRIVKRKRKKDDEKSGDENDEKSDED